MVHHERTSMMDDTRARMHGFRRWSVRTTASITTKLRMARVVRAAMKPVKLGKRVRAMLRSTRGGGEGEAGGVADCCALGSGSKGASGAA